MTDLKVIPDHIETSSLIVILSLAVTLCHHRNRDSKSVLCRGSRASLLASQHQKDLSKVIARPLRRLGLCGVLWQDWCTADLV